MTKVTGKFQITLPKAVVDRCGIRVGDELELRPIGRSIQIDRRTAPDARNQAFAAPGSGSSRITHLRVPLVPCQPCTAQRRQRQKLLPDPRFGDAAAREFIYGSRANVHLGDCNHGELRWGWTRISYSPNSVIFGMSVMT